jgi:hypothetical protein
MVPSALGIDAAAKPVAAAAKATMATTIAGDGRVKRSRGCRPMSQR